MGAYCGNDGGVDDQDAASSLEWQIQSLKFKVQRSKFELGLAEMEIERQACWFTLQCGVFLSRFSGCTLCTRTVSTKHCAKNY